MTWFYVDDRLHSHRKAMKAGVEAMGLWVLAGSHVAGHETDGFIPDYVALRLAPNAVELADRLVHAGLWIAGQSDGDSGWWFHDWTGGSAGWQKSHEELEAERARNRDKQARYRERQRDGVSNRSRDGHRDQGANRSRDESVPGSVTTPHPFPSPPLPEPPTGVQEEHEEETTPEPAQTAGKASASRKRSASVKGHRLPDDWWPADSDLAWFRDHCPTLAAESGAGSSATASFRDYWHAATGRNSTKRDWTAAWRYWLREEERKAKARTGRRGPAAPRQGSDDRVAAFLAGGEHAQPYDVPLPGIDPAAAQPQLPGGDQQ